MIDTLNNIYSSELFILSISMIKKNKLNINKGYENNLTNI